jgi:hypothetical protein
MKAMLQFTGWTNKTTLMNRKTIVPNTNVSRPLGGSTKHRTGEFLSGMFRNYCTTSEAEARLNDI